MVSHTNIPQISMAHQVPFEIFSVSFSQVEFPKLIVYVCFLENHKTFTVL